MRFSSVELTKMTKKIKYDGFFTIFFHELTEIMGGGT